MIEVIFTPAARDEVFEARDWYDAVATDLSGDFCRALDRAVMQISEFPHAFEVVLGDVQRILLRRSPYALFYRLTPDAVVVIACFHSSRDPRKWQKR